MSLIDIEIFRAGNWTSSSGQEGSYSHADLEEIAQGYNPALHGEAPIVAGHPTDNSPAYGWVKSLRVMGDKLIATVGDLQPELVDAVRRKLYKYVSVALRNRDHPANPTPGKMSLAHVGMVPLPAVKGLAPVAFADEGELTVLEVSFNEQPLVEAPMGKPETEAPETKQAPPVAELKGEELKATATQPLQRTDYSQVEVKLFGEVVKTEQMKAEYEAKFAELDQAKKELAAYAQAIEAETKRLQKERKEAEAYSESVRKERAINAIQKAQKEGRCSIEFAELAEQLALSLPYQSKDEMSFSDESVGKATPFDAFIALIDRMPRILPANHITEDGFKPEAINFSVPTGYEIDSDRGTQYAKAMAYCAKNNFDSSNRDHLIAAFRAVEGK